MSGMPSGGFRARHDEIAARLESAPPAGTRDALKEEISTLYREVERELAALGSLREDVRALVERWKAHYGPAARTTPPSSPAPAAPVVADHLGASTFIEKGWSRISMGDFVAAEEALRRALTLAPDDPQAESLLGWALLHQQRDDDAMLAFQRVLMRQPDNALARMNVGYLCLRKQIFGEAIEHLSRAIRLDNDPKATLYAHYYLGLVYLEREMFDDAAAFFIRALALGPNLVEARYELGRARWLGGDRDGAREAWREGAAANKFSPWGTRCAEMLAEVDRGGAPPRSQPR